MPTVASTISVTADSDADEIAVTGSQRLISIKMDLVLCLFPNNQSMAPIVGSNRAALPFQILLV